MCGLYCIALIEYMIAGKTLLDYTNSFSPNYYKKNDKIIYKYFKDTYGKRKHKPWLSTKKIDETRYEHLLILAFAVSGSVPISAFVSLVLKFL